jgi:orotate phosphoribosyltransferase
MGPRGRSLAIRKVLVVDDSTSSGQSLQKIKKELEGSDFQISFGAVYASTEYHPDYYYRIVPTPRIFQWNIMHHSYLANSCIDIDGVLCENPTEEQNDDGPHYLEFLKCARPIVRPTVRIKNLVTCRLEKYRSLTEDWLGRQGIEYQNLFMMDYPDKVSRVRAGRHAEYKAQIYINSNTILFVEDSMKQAQKIAKITSKPVLCTSSWTLF